jgi:hypothetical protein
MLGLLQHSAGVQRGIYQLQGHVHGSNAPASYTNAKVKLSDVHQRRVLDYAIQPDKDAASAFARDQERAVGCDNE